VTIETALTITNERISMTVDLNNGSAPTLVLDNVTGATSGTDNDLNYITNCDAGLMQLELSAANTNYLGRAFLTVTDAANHVPVFHEFTILPANVYDALILGSATDYLDVSVVQLAGSAIDQTSGLINANVKQISTDATAADNAESFFDGTGYAGTNNVIPTVTTLTGHTAQTGDAFARLGAPAGASVSADIAAVKSDTGSILTDTNELQTDLVNGGRLDLIVDAIKAKTDNLPASPAATSDIPSAATISDAVWDEATSGHTGGGSTGKALTDANNGTPPTAASIRTEIDSNSTQLAAIVADTNEIQLELADGGRTDLLIDGIAAKTTNLPSDPADQSAVESAITSATSSLALQASVDDLEGRLTATRAGYLDNLSAGAVALEATAQSILTDTGTTLDGKIDTIDGIVDAIKLKTDNLPSDPADESLLEAAITAATSPLSTAAEMAKVPKSDGDVTWNATALASINSEVDTALNTAIPGTPTADSINQRVAALDTLTEASGAGDLAAILVDTGTTIPATLATLSGEGSGSSANVITITDGTNPIADADVWASTDSAGSNIIAGTLQTNASGQVTFMLDVGIVYYLWVQKDGYNFTNPTTYTGV
jgi:hypothetical protein